MNGKSLDSGQLFPLAAPVAVPNADADAVAGLPVGPDLRMGQRLGRAVIIIEPERNLVDLRQRRRIPDILEVERRVHEKANRVGMSLEQADADVLFRPRHAGGVGQKNDIRVPAAGNRAGAKSPGEERFNAFTTFQENNPRVIMHGRPQDCNQAATATEPG